MNKAGRSMQQEIEVRKENSPETNDLLKKLLNGEEITETITTSRGNFVMKYPRPKVFRQVQILLSQRFPNVDLGKLAEKSLRFHEMYAILDMVVVKAPSWWDELDSSEDCPDDDLIMDLYGRYLQFYGEVQSKISGDRKQSGGSAGPDAPEPEKAPVGDGLFSGISHEPAVPGPDGGAD